LFEGDRLNSRVEVNPTALARVGWLNQRKREVMAHAANGRGK
jgi:hypothetical protein